jgi:photosystem II stability/assembly factor-like uncharacterized protein
MNKNITLILCLLSILFSTNAQAQWSKTNGPEGMSVEALYEYGTAIFCGTNSQGVYKSVDNGNTWVASSTGLELKWIDCFANDNTYLYAGVFGSGVYRSSDNGATWQPANNGIGTEAVFCLLNAGGYLWAGTVGNGLFRSADHGNTWVNANGGALNSSFITAMFYRNGRINVEADNLVFYSYDLGNTWYLDDEPIQYYQIYDFYVMGDTIFASGFNSFFRSIDGGVHWSNAYYFDSGIAGFDRIGNTVYAASLGNLYYTNDWGLTWQTIVPTGLRQGAGDFIIAGNNNFLVCREEIGIAISTDTGNNWTDIPLSQFARASNIDDAIWANNDFVLCGTHGNGLFRSTDHGDNWTKIGTTNPLDTLSNERVFSTLFIEPNIILVGGCGDGLFRSADNGVTWTHITAGIPFEDVYGDHFSCIHTLEKCGPNILAACWMGVVYSTDNGLTWNPTNLQDPPENGYMDPAGFAIRGNVACVGVSSYPQTKGIYRSTNYGVTWTLAAPMQAADIITMATGGGSTMYAGDLFSTMVSHDDGFSWGGVGVGGAFALLAWNEYAFVGNNDGIFFSDDFGDSWAIVNEGIDPYPNNACQALAADSTYVYAGFYRNAVWRRPLTDFGFDPPACTTVVTSPLDNGPGTLRDIVGCAPSGSTITFSLAPLTSIDLTSGEIIIDKNLTIAGTGVTNLSVTGNASSRIFHVLPGADLFLQNISLKDANSPIDGGGAILADGNLTLQNVFLVHNYENGSIPRSLRISGGQTRVLGNVEIHP